MSSVSRKILINSFIGLSLLFGIMVSSPSASAADEMKVLDAQLGSGEFVSALETAKSSKDNSQKSEMLKKVANAQMKSGDFDSATATINRIPSSDNQSNARSNNARGRSLAGGGADFEPLMDLIRSEVAPDTWSENGGEGEMTPFEQGVSVDPNGLLSRVTRKEQTNRLKSLGIRARKANLNKDMAKASSLRMVSLTRLEKEVAAQIAAGKSVVESMKNMAGLSKIQYVFVYPETGDVVIAGPAEGWNYDTNGSPIGANSGHPTLQLDDLVTVLRTFSPAGEGKFGCSINARSEGIAKLRSFVQQTNERGALPIGSTGRWVKELQNQLGLQDIVTYGVPENSRVARVIVEADYRMKLIGIGKMNAGSSIPDYFDLMTVAEQKNIKSLDALRWWLTMKYDQVLHSADKNAYEIKGSSVLCQSENQFINSKGQNVPTGKSDVTNRLFAAKFTQHYAELAKRDSVFADMQNIFDLALVAALINQDGVNSRVNWSMESFSEGGSYTPASYATPTVVNSVVNHRVFRGKDVVVQVAGGVRGNLASVLETKTVASSPRLKNVASDAKAPQLPEGRWWWDVKN